jgi:hypothetical protein
VVMGTVRLQMFKWRLVNFEFDIEQQSEKMITALLALIRKP